MNTYTIYWTPAQQSAMLIALPFLQNELSNAVWCEEPEYPHYALVCDLSTHQYDEAVECCLAETIAGIKPGSNPGGSPTGCA